jgi:hypothetical protein
MPKDLTTPHDETVVEPQTRISPQNARQGRTGKHTLTILVISLVLAVLAGVAVGFIPIKGD